MAKMTNKMVDKAAAKVAPMADEDKWKVESAARTLMDGEKYRKDPDMMKKVAAHLTEQKSCMEGIMGKK